MGIGQHEEVVQHSGGSRQKGEEAVATHRRAADDVCSPSTTLGEIFVDTSLSRGSSLTQIRAYGKSEVFFFSVASGQQ